jgi:hypothetical protein
MELHARLVHAEAGLRVVEVRASRGEHSLGSALAEAPTAQEAEDLATARLLQRLEAMPSTDLNQTPAELPPRSPSRHPRPTRVTAATAAPAPAEGQDPSAADAGLGQQAPRPQPAAAAVQGSGGAGTAAAAPPEATPEPRLDRPAGPASAASTDAEAQLEIEEEPPADPEDWSQELIGVDLQLRRLGWSREQEGLYLQRAFGHPSRTRLTRYSDLRSYLVALEGLEAGSDPALAAVPLRRSELLAQGDALLRQLGWNAEQGRAFLERQLNRISRQQLNDVQLLEFNMLLEGELLAAGTALAMAAPEGAQR